MNNIFDQLRKITPDEAERSAALCCAKVGEVQTPPVDRAHQEQCAACHTPIWVANTSPKAPRRLCGDCALEYIEGLQAAGHNVEAVTHRKTH